MPASESMSFHTKNMKTIFKMLGGHQNSKKIVPTLPPRSEKCHLRSGSVEKGVYYPTTSSNRAHLIATQRELLKEEM